MCGLLDVVGGMVEEKDPTGCGFLLTGVNLTAVFEKNNRYLIYLFVFGPAVRFDRPDC